MAVKPKRHFRIYFPVHQLRRGFAGHVPVPDLFGCAERPRSPLADEAHAAATLPALSGAGRGREAGVQEVSGRARCGSAEAAGEGEVSR